MNLAFITHNYPLNKNERSNAGIFVADLAENLAAKGHSILLFVLNADLDKVEILFNGKLKVYFLGKGSLNKSLGRVKPYNIIDVIKTFNLFIKGKTSIISILKSQKIDFCVAFWAIPSGIITYQVCKKLKIPFAIWALGSDIYIYKNYPIIGHLISQSMKMSKLLLADGINLARIISNISSKNCIFLPSATDFKETLKIKSSVSKKNIRFVYLGRMEAVKGPDVLLDAITRIGNVDFELHMIGGGTMLSALQKKAKDANLDKKVFFYGNINSSSEIFTLLSSSDWLIIPSRSDSIPLVFSEGMKARIPVIVSEVGDMVELVRKYKVGLSFPKEDSEKLSILLKKVIKKGRQTRNGYASNTKKLTKIFNSRNSAKQLIENINKVLKNMEKYE